MPAYAPLIMALQSLLLLGGLQALVGAVPVTSQSPSPARQRHMHANPDDHAARSVHSVTQLHHLPSASLDAAAAAAAQPQQPPSLAAKPSSLQLPERLSLSRGMSGSMAPPAAAATPAPATSAKGNDSSSLTVLIRVQGISVHQVDDRAQQALHQALASLAPTESVATGQMQVRVNSISSVPPSRTTTKRIGTSRRSLRWTLRGLLPATPAGLPADAVLITCSVMVPTSQLAEASKLLRGTANAGRLGRQLEAATAWPAGSASLQVSMQPPDAQDGTTFPAASRHKLQLPSPLALVIVCCAVTVVAVVVVLGAPQASQTAVETPDSRPTSPNKAQPTPPSQPSSSTVVSSVVMRAARRLKWSDGRVGMVSRLLQAPSSKSIGSMRLDDKGVYSSSEPRESPLTDDPEGSGPPSGAASPLGSSSMQHAWAKQERTSPSGVESLEQPSCLTRLKSCQSDATTGSMLEGEFSRGASRAFEEDEIEAVRFLEAAGRTASGQLGSETQGLSQGDSGELQAGEVVVEPRVSPATSGQGGRPMSRGRLVSFKLRVGFRDANSHTSASLANDPDASPLSTSGAAAAASLRALPQGLDLSPASWDSPLHSPLSACQLPFAGEPSPLGSRLGSRRGEERHTWQPGMRSVHTLPTPAVTVGRAARMRLLRSGEFPPPLIIPVNARRGEGSVDALGRGFSSHSGTCTPILTSASELSDAPPNFVGSPLNTSLPKHLAKVQAWAQSGHYEGTLSTFPAPLRLSDQDGVSVRLSDQEAEAEYQSRRRQQNDTSLAALAESLRRQRLSVESTGRRTMRHSSPGGFPQATGRGQRPARPATREASQSRLQYEGGRDPARRVTTDAGSVGSTGSPLDSPTCLAAAAAAQVGEPPSLYSLLHSLRARRSVSRPSTSGGSLSLARSAASGSGTSGILPRVLGSAAARSRSGSIPTLTHANMQMHNSLYGSQGQAQAAAVASPGAPGAPNAAVVGPVGPETALEQGVDELSPDSQQSRGLAFKSSLRRSDKQSSSRVRFVGPDGAPAAEAALDALLSQCMPDAGAA